MGFSFKIPVIYSCQAPYSHSPHIQPSFFFLFQSFPELLHLYLSRTSGKLPIHCSFIYHLRAVRYSPNINKTILAILLLFILSVWPNCHKTLLSIFHPLPSSYHTYIWYFVDSHYVQQTPKVIHLHSHNSRFVLPASLDP